MVGQILTDLYRLANGPVTDGSRGDGPKLQHIGDTSSHQSPIFRCPDLFRAEVGGTLKAVS